MERHIYQQLTLKKLLYSLGLKFSELQIEGLTSKHFNYHLQELMDDKLVEKDDTLYKLTNLGKDFVGRLNDRDMTLEKQPKISVMIIPYEFQNEQRMILVNKKLKQPYFGKVGDYTGKVRFGESIEQAAKRELFEETGLTGDFTFAKMIRKLAHKEKEIVQDNIFYLFRVTNLNGNLIDKTNEHQNFWIEESELRKRDDLYNTFLTFLDLALNNKDKFDEFIVEAEGF